MSTHKDPSKPTTPPASPSAVEQLVDLVKQLQLQVKELTNEIGQQKKAIQDLTTEVRSQKNSNQDMTAHAVPLSQARSRIAPKEEHIAISRYTNYHCEHCGKLLELTDWFRCHECEDCNFCRACFETQTCLHANASHTFSDMSALPRVFNRPGDQFKALVDVASQRCDVCKKELYPYKASWFRCNKCRNYQLCDNCWEKGHVAHKENRHTFTDMSTTLRNQCGFPAIENDERWGEKKANFLNKCSNCSRKIIGSAFFHCNQCASPSYDLCGECVVSTEVWRTHSAADHAAHTFTNVNKVLK